MIFSSAISERVLTKNTWLNVTQLLMKKVPLTLCCKRRINYKNYTRCNQPMAHLFAVAASRVRILGSCQNNVKFQNLGTENIRSFHFTGKCTGR